MPDTAPPQIVPLEMFRAILAAWEFLDLNPHCTISVRGIDQIETREVEARAWLDDGLDIWTGGFVPHPVYLPTHDALLNWLHGR